VPYSSADDLLLGDLPLGAAVDREKYVADAADEIDSAIGHVYATPVDMTEGGPVARHSRLLLKRINNHLATGRIILAVSIGGEDDSLQAYGRSLIREAHAALGDIATGAVELIGAETVEGGDVTNGPVVVNFDQYSGVDAFYDNVMRVELGQASPAWAPGAG